MARLQDVRRRALSSSVPPPRLLLSDWIEASVVLPSGTTAVPGPIRLYSYQRAIADSTRAVAIIGLTGREEHWTVVYRATSRTLRLADSCGSRLIFRSQCTLVKTSLRYRLRPSEVLVVKHENRRSFRKPQRARVTRAAPGRNVC